MIKVLIEDRKNEKRYEVECEEWHNASDLKGIIWDKIEDSALIYHEGKIVEDDLVLKTLGDKIILSIERDIEMSKISCDFDEKDSIGEVLEQIISPERGTIKNIEVEENKTPLSHELRKVPLVLVNTDEGSKYVKQSDIFMIDGKKYLITRRRKKITWKYIADQINSFLSKPLIIQSLVLSLILLTDNHFLFFIIMMIKLLRFMSTIFVSNRHLIEIRSDISKAVVSFFASFLFIDHDELYRRT